MDIPGLHSIFSSAKISLLTNVEYSITVSKSDPRFNFIRLKCVLPNIHANLDTFFRSPPIKVLDCSHLKLIARSNNFKNARALIIGGSRGLGAWCAKILASNGADVTITYHRSKDQATSVLSDIKKSGFKCKLEKMSIIDGNPTTFALGNFNQIYYFPTSKIFIKRSSTFEHNLFIEFRNIYVTGFKKIFNYYHHKGRKFFLSLNSHINENIQSLQEYIRAKFEGERFVNIYAISIGKCSYSKTSQNSN